MNWKTLQPLVALLVVSALAASLGTCELHKQDAGSTNVGAMASPEFDARYGAMIRGALDTIGVGGLQYGVIQANGESYSGGYGFSNSSEMCRMDGQRRLNVASLSKPVTALLTLILHEKGVIHLDSSVFSYAAVPEMNFEPYTRQITFRNILKHRAGLSLPSAPFFSVATPKKSALEVVMGNYPEGEPVRALFRPDSLWMYSGGGYTLLQHALEQTTGKSLDRLAGETIFKPLGMTASAFNPTYANQSCNEQYYGGDGQPLQPYYTVGEAAGGLSVSAADMVKFMEELLRMREGNSRLLSKSTFDQIAAGAEVVDLSIFGIETQAHMEDGPGFFVHRDGEEVVLYHSGGNPGVVAYLILSTTRRKGIFLSVNTEAGRGLVEALLTEWGESEGVNLPPFF